MPDVFTVKITSSSIIAYGICSVSVACGDLAAEARAGQFLHIKCGHSRILRRPISICSVDADLVRFIFEIRGEGTKWLSERQPGQTLDILGPLGNGYNVPASRIIVAGGGIGVPPLLYAARSAETEAAAVLGFRDKRRVILENEFKTVCKETIVTTDDGSAGLHGQVTAPLAKLLESSRYSAVLSCGPVNMLKSVAALCRKYKTPCQVSLEQRMGCGIGACLVCVCAIKRNGADEMNRVCADGPVFNAEDVRW